ncbi:MAG: carboxypeptidase regulatory-like domain-containing protein [Thermoplasmatota archaeon]
MTRSVRSVGIAFILLLSSFLVAGVIGQETDSQGDANVTGKVVDAATGDGLQAVVYIAGLRSDRTWTFESNEKGLFRGYLPAGPYVWEAEARGYNPGRGEFEVGENGAELKRPLKAIKEEDPPEDPPQVNLKGRMVKEGTREGVMGYLSFIDQNEKTYNTKTDEEGFFKGLLPPGLYLWKAGARGYENQMGRLQIGREVVELIIQMVPLESEEPEPEFGILYGMVMGPEKEPIPGAHIMIHPMMERDPAVDASGAILNDEMAARGPIELRTDREGMFKVRLPFGIYILMVHAEGFMPQEMEVRITPRMPEQRLHVIMEPEGPPIDWGRVKMVFSMEDPNSDGIPELVHFAADLDGDGEHDIAFKMVDRNSDGNPESVEWMLNIPMDQWEWMKALVMRFIENRGEKPFHPPEPEPRYPGDPHDRPDGDPNADGSWDHPEDDIPPLDPDQLKELLENEGREQEDDAGNDLDDSGETGDITEDGDPPGVKDKGASTAPVLEIAAAVGALFLLMLLVLVAVVLIRRKMNS